MEQSVKQEVDDAVSFAESGTWEPVETLTRHVYSEPSAKAAP
jgi:TPP-dependent pyruvate/acetoin dehydrogenase alpha subunit